MDDPHIEVFLDMLAAERGCSNNTLAAYRRNLENLAAHAGAQRLPAEVSNVSAYGTYCGLIQERVWLIWLVILSGVFAVLQAPGLHGFSLDPFSLV